jgi:hypothetical protein
MALKGDQGARMEACMTHRNYIIVGILSVIFAINAPLSIWAQERVDHSIFGDLLKSHSKNGLVDYQGFKSDEKALARYLGVLEKVDPESLSRSEQMAFYINAYNAWTIKLILTKYPGVKTIKDLGTLFQSPWEKKFVKINGKDVSLDHIEHDILRPQFKDPRIHFAVNCASKSCPPLLGEPFTGTQLQRQLDGVTKSFINDPKSTFIKGDKLYVSRIFKWFGEDFGNDILGFVRSYAQGALAQNIGNGDKKLKIRYLDYDWSLNGT